MNNDITAVILAGGRGQRLGGADKGLETLNGRPLIEHVIGCLSSQVNAILINCNRNHARYASYGLPLITDRLPDFPGPLAGIQAALHACQTPLILTVPCDTPFLPKNLVRALNDSLQDGDAAVACTPSRQPVIALYRSTVLPALEQALAEGERSVGRWQQQLDCRECHFSSDTEAFRNLNHFADWPK